jgi:hypothetical protein
LREIDTIWVVLMPSAVWLLLIAAGVAVAAVMAFGVKRHSPDLAGLGVLSQSWLAQHRAADRPYSDN